jgi:serine/threonine protein kinase
MLTKDPEERISAIDALHHEWFNLVNKTEVDSYAV